jgi:hypothetical protein
VQTARSHCHEPTWGTVMSTPGMWTNDSQAPLRQHMDQPFPISDQVLLCSFDLDLRGHRTTQQLRHALIAAGFLPRATDHLIRVSRLLRRSSRGCYQLRPFQL